MRKNSRAQLSSSQGSQSWDANGACAETVNVNLVDERGFEPPASSLRTMRSPS